MIKRAGYLLLMRLVLCGLQLLVLGGGALAADKVLDASRMSQVPVSLTDYFAVLEDPSRTLTLDDVQTPAVAARFKTDLPPGEALNYGPTASAHWLRLHVSNPGDQTVERMLEIASPALFIIQFHQPDGNKVYRTVVTGKSRPFVERPYPNRFFVFPISLPAQSEQVIYLKITTAQEFFVVPARLWERKSFHAYERRDYVIQAWYFGMVMALAVFNMLLFAFLRNAAYLFYVAFASAVALTFAANTGLGAEFLWGNSPVWARISVHETVSLSAVVLMLFMQRMFVTRVLVPKLDRALKLMVIVNIGFSLSAPAYFATISQPMTLVHAVSALLIFATSIVCALLQQRNAYFFVAAFSVLCVGVLLNTVHLVGIKLSSTVTEDGPQMSSALALLLMAFALVDGFNVIRREKAEAQRLALLAQEETLRAQADALEAQHRMVEALRSSERLLEGRVAERTAELSATVDHLKKTQADLVQAEKLASLGALVAGVAHELKVPIGVALITASDLENDAKEFQGVLNRGELRKASLTQFVESTVPMAELISKSCETAATLISSFKQVAVDQTSEQRRVFDLCALVDDNIAALRPTFQSASWRLEVDIATGISCDSYPGPLGQVIANLVQNAAMHAFAGRDGGSDGGSLGGSPGDSFSGVLRITASVQSDSVRMIFADDGNGMEAEVLAHIFEPFYTARTDQGNPGLGLSISLNIVTGVLGGSLYASSEPGAGSIFTVNFPLVAPTQAPQSKARG